MESNPLDAADPRSPRAIPPDFAMPVAPRRPRRWLHAVLFGATLVTATIAGSWFWEAAPDTGDAGVASLFRPDVLVRGLPYALLLLAILGAHEMGHYLACRRYGVPASLPYFIPGIPLLVGTFGAVIRIRGPIPNRRALFDIAAAGPIAGFLVALPVLALGVARATVVPHVDDPHGMFLGPPLISSLFERLLYGDADLQVGSIYGAAWVGMLVTSMNLFPAGQLDGGHAVFAIAPRIHRVVSWVTIAAVATLVVSQTVITKRASAYTLWLGILLVLRGRHPRLVDESAPLGRGRVAVAILLALIFVATFIPVPLAIL